MEPDKKPDEKPEEQQTTVDEPKAESQETVIAEPQAPADALSLTPDELDDAQASQVTATSDPNAQPTVKKTSAFKRISRKLNVYFLIFVLLLVIAGIIAVVTYLNSQKPQLEPNIATQQLTEDALKQLNNTDATVGDAAQTLTIKGNAIIDGQTLMRGNLNVAGNIQAGGSVQSPSLTISGTANLAQAQINSLQVASNMAIQGTTTLRDLNVAGATSFSGSVTASQITVTRLILTGNAVLQIPNHISFTGTTPNRTVNTGVTGTGSSSSVSGSDTTGTVNISTGNNPAAGCMVRINFQQAFSNEPHVIISPVGSTASQIQYYVDRNKSGFSICTNNAAPGNRSFAYDYFVTN